MSATALLHRLYRMGAAVSVEDGDLLIDGVPELSGPFLAELKAHKPELITLLLTDASNDDRVPISPMGLTHALEADGLESWLRDEGLCLVLRDGVLLFTEPDGRGSALPSAALRQHVTTHYAAIVELLTSTEA